MPRKNIIWLASYPKSGNTWVRIFLANYLKKNNDPVKINKIDSSFISSSRSLFDKYSGTLSSDLSLEEIDNLRPLFYEHISKDTNQLQFIKVHDAHTINSNNQAIFPDSISKGVIHIVRNPADVAVSFAHHLGISNTQSISNLNNEHFSLAGKPGRLHKQFRQKLLSWSMHYKSWKDSGLNYLIVRYEDLLEQPHIEFERIIRFSGLNYNKEKLSKAIENSSFNKLQKEEAVSSFKEKPIKSKQFFRQGKSGGWESELELTDIKTILKHHSEIIKELNYFI